MYYIKVDLKHGLERPVHYAIYELSLGLYHFTVLSLLDNMLMMLAMRCLCKNTLFSYCS